MPLARDSMRLLGLGLDAALIETLKKAIKAQRLSWRLSFAAELKGLSTGAVTPDFIVLKVPGQFGQSLRLVQDIRFRHPKATLLVVSSSSDANLLVHFFRAGASDVLLQPVDQAEIAQALRRVAHRPGDMHSPQDWTPLQAAAHFLTRPLADHWDELADNLDRYFSLFFAIGRHERFTKSPPSLASDRKFQRFMKDPHGVFFGLGIRRGKMVWVVKLASNFVGMWEGELQKGDHREVFGRQFMNLLRGQRELFQGRIEREHLHQLALTDEITGLWNQRRLQQDLDARVATQELFSLLFIDIDFFKNVNDRFGHIYGSQLLVDMAKILRRELRDSDHIYRYGGDEFIILLPKARLDEAKKIAIRLSEAIKNHEFTVQEGPYRLSLSVGIAEYPQDASTAKDLVNFADKMMYMSKKSGRGKVFHVTEVQ